MRERLLEPVAVFCVVPANWHKALAQPCCDPLWKNWTSAFVWLIKLVLWRNQKYKSCSRPMLCPRWELEHKLLPPNYSETNRYSQSSPGWQSLACWGTRSVHLLRAMMWDCRQLEQGNTNPFGYRVSPWCRTKEEFQHHAFPRHKSNHLDASLDLTHQEQHHVQHEVKHRGIAWEGVCREADGKGGYSNTIMASMEERGRLWRGLGKNSKFSLPCMRSFVQQG